MRTIWGWSRLTRRSSQIQMSSWWGSVAWAAWSRSGRVSRCQWWASTWTSRRPPARLPKRNEAETTRRQIQLFSEETRVLTMDMPKAKTTLIIMIDSEKATIKAQTLIATTKTTQTGRDNSRLTLRTRLGTRKILRSILNLTLSVIVNQEKKPSQHSGNYYHHKKNDSLVIQGSQ